MKNTEEKTEVKEIKFYNDTLLGVKDESGQVWLLVKKTCSNLGFTDSQTRTQIQKMTEDKILKSNCQEILIVQNEGERQVKRALTCIKEQCVTIWLAKIQLTDKMEKSNPDLFEKLIKYQLDAQKVLHEHFMGTEEKKQEFYNYLGLEGEIVTLQHKIENLEETLDAQKELFYMTMDNMTLSTRQQEKILEHARKRVNYLLGGAHSEEYKNKARTYLVNLWNNLKEQFHCGASYKDLNPLHYELAIDFINNWNYN